MLLAGVDADVSSGSSGAARGVSGSGGSVVSSGGAGTLRSSTSALAPLSQTMRLRARPVRRWRGGNMLGRMESEVESDIIRVVCPASNSLDALSVRPC